MPKTKRSQLQNTVLAMLLLSAFSTPLMLSAVNVAIPTIAEDLQMSAVSLSWIPMAYLMTSAMFVLIFGRLADLYGRRRIFLFGTAAVIVSSIVASAAPNSTVLLIARSMQGLSTAMLYATQIAIISSVFPGNKRGQYIGILVSIIYIGLASGPLLGGILVDAYGWRASFLVQVPLAITALYLGVFKIDVEWRAPPQANNGAAFDLGGAINYALAILLLCVGVSLLPQTRALLLIACGIAALYWFITQAKQKPDPIWDVSLFFTNRVFTASCLAALLMYSATYANVLLISLYLQYLKDFSATEAGLIMMIQPAVMAAFSPLAGRLSDRFEARLLVSLGMVFTVFGLALLSQLQSSSSISSIIIPLMITGLGFSLFSTPNSNAILASVDVKHLGNASSAIATMRILGQVSSMIIVTLVLALMLGPIQIGPAHFPLLEHSIQISFMIAAMICLPGLFFSITRGKTQQPRVSRL